MKMTHTNSRRRIPTPDYEGEGAVFYPIAKVGSWEPFGYTQDPDDPHLLQPVSKELLLLEQAKTHMSNGFSLRDVARWLSAESGRSISHQGLKTRASQDQKRDKDSVSSRHIAKQLVEAFKKAKRIEALRLGKKVGEEIDLEREIFALVMKEQDSNAS